MAAPMEKQKDGKPHSARVERRLKWWKEHRPKEDEKAEHKGTDKTGGKNVVKRKSSTLSEGEPPKKETKTEKGSSTEDESQCISTEVAMTTDSGQQKKIKEKHFVLFVGNLPYTITKDDVFQYFTKEAGGVKAVRLLTDKNTGKPKGFAYVEFEHARSYKQALRLHQSQLGGRKINVEFTSIGGNNERRKEKLKRKNKTLAKFKLPVDPNSAGKKHTSAHWKRRDNFGHHKKGRRGGKRGR